MPNIIEQQDLLKGLPDSRLATLMESPTGDIPPFLVAAEAQRRQSIRQQFAGGGTKESVVDTLTKQMANVPQNIQSQPSEEPQEPQEEQAGIGALEEGQQMANGGMVQRYQTGGKIQPMWQIPNYGGVIPQVMDWVGGKASDLYEYATTPYSKMKPSPDGAEDEISPGAGILDIQYPDAKIVKGRNPLPEAPRNPTAGQSDTSNKNQKKPVEDEIRKRIEALYASDDPSNWEEAQKWFAMSAQFLDGDKTLMQSLAAAGSVYAGAEAEQARMSREDARAREEALLRYDIGKADDEASNASAALKARTDIATGQLDDLYRQQRDVAEQLRRIDESVMKGEIEPAQADSAKRALSGQFNSIGSKITAYEGFIGETYGFPTIPVVDAAAGTIK